MTSYSPNEMNTLVEMCLMKVYFALRLGANPVKGVRYLKMQIFVSKKEGSTSMAL